MRQRISENLDSVTNLERLPIFAITLRTNDRDIVSSPPKRQALWPNASITRNRKVFDEEEEPLSHWIVL
jgi:hypothetical protein